MKKVHARKSTLKREINPMPKNIRAALIGPGAIEIVQCQASLSAGMTI